MIKITRFNNSELWINAEMIEFVEATPDTVITLVNKEKFIAKESAEAIVEAVMEYRRQIFHQRPQIIKTETQYKEEK